MDYMFYYAPRPLTRTSAVGRRAPRRMSMRYQHPVPLTRALYIGHADGNGSRDVILGNSVIIDSMFGLFV